MVWYDAHRVENLQLLPHAVRKLELTAQNSEEASPAHVAGAAGIYVILCAVSSSLLFHGCLRVIGKCLVGVPVLFFGMLMWTEVDAETR